MKVEYVVDKGDQKVCICVDAYANGFDMKYAITDIGVKQKGQRKFRYIGRVISDCYSYRCLSMVEKQAYVKAEFLKRVDELDLRNAVEYAYAQIKPDFSKVDYRVF